MAVHIHSSESFQIPSLRAFDFGNDLFACDREAERIASRQLLPEGYEMLYDTVDICERIGRYLPLIEEARCKIQAATGQDACLVPLLNGGGPLAVMISERTGMPVSPIRAVAYDPATDAPLEKVEVSLPPEFDPKGRGIILIDDIRERGMSLAAGREVMAAMGANMDHFKSLVLLTRAAAVNPVFEATWSLFTYDGPHWVEGMGLNKAGRPENRYLPFVCYDGRE